MNVPPERRERGFTLLELMVVVSIIAILMAIAIPFFLGLRSRANDSAAKAGIHHAFKAAKITFVDDNSYAGTTVGQLAAAEPSMQFVDESTESTDPNMASLKVVAPDTIVLAVRSNAGNCFGLRDVVAAGGGTSYYTQFAGVCSADAMAAGATWGDAWL